MSVLTTYKPVKKKPTQERVDYSSLIVMSEKVRKLDPTRTTTLRLMFVKDMDRRFNDLKRLITSAIVDRDIFGLKEKPRQIASFAVPGANSPDPLPGYRQFEFATSADKVDGFMEWLNRQEEKGILHTTKTSQLGTAKNKAWTDIYITDSYKKGAARAIYEMKAVGVSAPDGFGLGMGFGLNTPIHADRLALLYTRTFNDLKGIDQAMDAQISRVLAQGLADGDNPIIIAKKINERVDGIGRNRARTLARTEVIRAHHSGMIQEYRNWGLAGVKVQAEWIAAGFRVCDECAKRDKKIYTLYEIEGMIPLHPNCRCMALPTVPEIKLK
jgi:SPP1 gp7 family putative phage head morphogenesis protein